MKHHIPILVLGIFLLASCNNDQEKGAIDQHNAKVAQEAVSAIKIPLEQAKAAAEQENAHTRQVEDQLKNQ